MNLAADCAVLGGCECTYQKGLSAMSNPTADYEPWIGRRELSEDDLGLAPALAGAAMLDDTQTTLQRRRSWAATGIRHGVVSCHRFPIRGECSRVPACVFTVRC